MIKDIIDEKLKVVSEKESESLGNRSEYVGASDVVQCPRKVILSKLIPQEFSLETLVKFKRGHLAETILSECFAQTKYKWSTQMEFIHPEYEYIKAHADFVFHTNNFSKIGIVEQKSVSFIPDEPYTSWVEQLQFQMGLAKLLYPDADIKGALFVIDMNSGKYTEFNGYSPNILIFDELLKKAKLIYEKVKAKEQEGLPFEEGLLCGFCPFKASCPAFTGDEVNIPEEILNMVKQYKEIAEEEKNIKSKKNSIKSSIREFTGNNFTAKFDGYKLSVKETQSERVDLAKLKEDYPDVFADVKKITPYISFRIS